MKAYNRHSFIIPSCSQWFDFEQIHELEQQSLPEFFCQKYPQKTPAVYLQSRNFIIKLYRERPTCYLSATECRRKIPGDICSIIRLHAFLEHWGLINFSVDSYLKPPMINLNSIGRIDQSLIDAISKGQLTIKEAEHMIAQRATPSTSSLQLLALQHQATLSKTIAPSCSLCGAICNFLWYTKKKTLPSPDTSLVNVLREIGGSVVACGECTKLDLTQYEPKTMKQILGEAQED